MEAEVLKMTQSTRRRRAVRRQIFLPRRARDPPAAPWRVAADRARRVVLGRPAGARQDHARRRVPRGAGAQSGEVSARGRTDELGGEVVQIDLEPADEGDPGDAVALSGQDAALAHRPDDRGARPRAREAARAAGKRAGAARLHQEPSGLLRRARRRRPRATRRARSARPRRGGWIPSSTSSRPRAARW